MGLRLIQACLEFVPRDQVKNIGGERRGIYVLYRKRGRIQSDRGRKQERFDVLYVGMTDFSIRGRLRQHARSKRKKAWTHFSAYAVWPNVTRDEICELEGLFRHIYRRDGRANILNLQRGFKALRKINASGIEEWRELTSWFESRPKR